MKFSIIAVCLMALGCERNASISVHKPTVTLAQKTIEASLPEALPLELKRTDYGLKHGSEGFKAVKWDESRVRFMGEPCIDLWTIQFNPGKLTMSGATRSTNSGAIVGDVQIYGGNLAISDKLILLGKSDEDGRFTINVALGTAGLAYNYLYTGGKTEPLIESAIPARLTQGETITR